MIGSRADRQDAIKKLVRADHVKTQSVLVDLLKEQGFAATQATISRDIAELGLEKDSNGAYVLPEDHRLRSVVRSAVRETRRAMNQVLLMCDPGAASSVAAALDASNAAGVLGSIAGDDTILVICAGEDEGKTFQEDMDKMIAGQAS